MPPGDYRSAIAAANRQFIEAFRRGDAGGLAGLYMADGQLLPPHSDIIMGRDGIRAFWQRTLDLDLKAATLQTVEAQASDHFAVEVGKYTLVGADGQETDAGKYIVIWRNDMGKWLLHRDISNTNRPAPGR